MRLLLVLSLASCVTACSAGQSAAVAPERPPAETMGAEAASSPAAEPATPGPEAEPPSRTLAPRATFADLVAVLRARPPLDRERPSDCLLEGGAAGAPARVAAAASLAPGEADRDQTPLAIRVKASPLLRVGVVTPHGQARERDVGPGVWLGTLTPVSADFSRASPLAVLWVTAETTWFTGILHHGTLAGDRWLRLEGIELDLFRRRVVPRATAIAVTADGDAPVTRVRETLEGLEGTAAEVAFAAAVEPPRSSRLAGPRDSLEDVDRRSPPPGLCPLGISDVPVGTTPGEPGRELWRARTSFQRALVGACAERLPAGSAGGAVGISMRLGADGAVAEACIERDFVGDEGLRECLLAAARAFSFPALERGDFLNLGLEVTFRPTGIPARPLCEP